MALPTNLTVILAIVGKTCITMYKNNTKYHLRTLIYILILMCLIFKESQYSKKGNWYSSQRYLAKLIQEFRLIGSQADRDFNFILVYNGHLKSYLMSYSIFAFLVLLVKQSQLTSCSIVCFLVLLVYCENLKITDENFKIPLMVNLVLYGIVSK